MNELESLNKELQNISNKRVKLETLVEQAKKQCFEIEERYGIKNESELKALLDKAEADYTEKVAEATTYIADVEQALLPYAGQLNG